MSKSSISTFELFQRFPDAESARLYFEAARWPDGAVCPACGEAKRIGTRKGGFYRCNACLNDFTVGSHVYNSQMEMTARAIASDTKVTEGDPAVVWWTFDLVREALVDAMRLWHRSPGEGRWPFASDGPWHLMTRDLHAGDYDARGGFDGSSDVALHPLPLTREEVARRDAISEWLQFVPATDDRILVSLCCHYYARGYRQLPWGKIKRRMKVERGKGGLRKRFERAIGVIATDLNTAEKLGSVVSRGQM